MANKQQLSSIKTLKQLDEAIANLDRDFDANKAKLKADYEYVKLFYSPVNLYNYILDKVSPSFNLIGLSLDLYDRLSERYAEFTARRRARAAQKVQPAEGKAIDEAVSEGTVAGESAEN